MAKERLAGDAIVRILARPQLQAGLRKASAKLRAFAGMVGGIGRKMVALSAAALAPLTLAAKTFASTGDTLDKMSKRTGFAASTLSELSFAAEQSGSNLQALEVALRNSSRFVVDLKLGMSTAKDVAQELGLSFEDLKGKSPEEVFMLLAEGIRNIDDPVQQAGLAMKAFGRSGTAVLPLLKSDIAALRKEAKDLGITLSDDDAAAAAELTDSMNRLKRQLKQVVVLVGAGVAGPLKQLQQRLAPIIKGVIDWTRNNREVFGTITRVAAAIGAAGVGLIAFSAILTGVAVTLSSMATIAGVVGGALATAFAVVTSPVTLVAATIAGVTAAFIKLSENGKQLGGQIARVFRGIAGSVGRVFSVLKDTIGGVVAAIQKGDIELAGQIAMKGLKLAFLQAKQELMPVFAKLVKGISALWDMFGKHLVGVMQTAAKQVVDLWAGATKGIANNLLELASQDNAFGAAARTLIGEDPRELQKEAERLGKGFKENAKNRLKDALEFKRQIEETGQAITQVTDANGDVQILADPIDADAVDKMIAEAEARLRDLDINPADVVADMQATASASVDRTAGRMTTAIDQFDDGIAARIDQLKAATSQDAQAELAAEIERLRASLKESVEKANEESERQAKEGFGPFGLVEDFVGQVDAAVAGANQRVAAAGIGAAGTFSAAQAKLFTGKTTDIPAKQLDELKEINAGVDRLNEEGGLVVGA